MSIDLEYAIKQDIRNNPVVREVDTEQKKELLRMLGRAVAVAGMFLIALAPRYKAASTGYSVEVLKDQLAREEVYYRQYRLELEQLLRPQVLQKRASTELGMIEPGEEDTLVIERVPAVASPNRAIVARAR